MDISELMFNRSIRQTDIAADRVSRLKNDRIDFDDEKKKKIARDFESIFLSQILDKMKDTIPDSEDEDPSAGQIKDMYWSFMGQAIADEGGLGLWEQIYKDIFVNRTGMNPDGNDTAAQQKNNINVNV